MTISTSDRRKSYPGNNVATVFAGPRAFDPSHITVYRVTGGQSTLVSSGYTLTGIGADNTTITMDVAPATGTTLLILRTVPYEQACDISNQGAYLPETLENAGLDPLAQQTQQLADAVSRSVRLPDSVLGTAAEISGPLTPLGPVVLNADATGFQIGSPTGTGDMLLRGDLASTLTGYGSKLVAFLQAGTGAVARWVYDKLHERPTVTDYGADPTGVADSTTAFNNAIAANGTTRIPAGTYLITGAVNVAAGKHVRTDGRRKTIIHMPSTFNASALGCFVLTGGEPGADIEGLTFIQDQPDSTTPTVYPPCIYAQNTPRFNLRRMRFACVYSAVDMKGNVGGAVLDDIEMSPLSIGIDIDGALDSVKIHKLHLWPFGNATTGTLTTNQRVAYTAATGIKSGRCDDLHISDSLFFSVINALSLYNSASGYTFGTITNCDFDDRGGLIVGADGRVQLAACTFSLGKTDSWAVKLAGGAVTLDGCRVTVNAINASANGVIEQTGGTLTLGSGCAISGSSFDAQLVYSANATLKLNGALFSRNSNVAYTAAMVRVINAKGSAVGCYASDIGTGSGKFIQIDTDVGFLVRANNLRGWAIGVPAASALANTMIDGNFGAGSNRDTFSGYFSSDATTTVKLPTGWTVSRAAAGTYNVTHNLSLADAKDMLPSLTPDLTASGALAQWDIAASTTSVLRVRTYVGTVLTDCGVAFCLRRYRS